MAKKCKRIFLLTYLVFCEILDLFPIICKISFRNFLFIRLGKPAMFPLKITMFSLIETGECTYPYRLKKSYLNVKNVS